MITHKDGYFMFMILNEDDEVLELVAFKDDVNRPNVTDKDDIIKTHMKNMKENNLKYIEIPCGTSINFLSNDFTSDLY